jgi:four helix bundle protein
MFMVESQKLKEPPLPHFKNLEASVQQFTQLRVWQKSHALVLQIYRLTKGFPLDERYGLISQLRRAALSVPTNVAEGSKRKTNTEYARFLNIAEGSLAEAQYLLMVSRDLGYLAETAAKPVLEQAGEIAKMLHGLRTKVGKTL